MDSASFEKMLAGLSSEQGRAQLVKRMVGSVDIAPEHVKKAIDFCVQAGQSEDAISIAESANMQNEAAAICIQFGEFERAAKIAEQSGDVSGAATYYAQAAEHHEGEGEHLLAARAAGKAGLPEDAARLFALAIDEMAAAERYYDALEIARESRLFAHGVEALAASDQLLMASDFAREAGMNDRAEELFNDTLRGLEDEQRYEEAVDLLIERGDNEGAVAVYEDAELFKDAARLAEELDLPEKALDCYVSASMNEDATRVAAKLKRYDRAVEIARSAGDLQEAARLAEQSGLADEAIDLYHQAGLINVAVEVARRNGKLEKAIEMLKVAGKKRLAEEAQRELDRQNRHRALMQECEAKGDFKGAARQAREAGLYDKVAFYRDLLDQMRRTPKPKRAAPRAEPRVVENREAAGPDGATPEPKRGRRSRSRRAMRRFNRR
jgi:tetratricopeptide (TPR) repeat protein